MDFEKLVEVFEQLESISSGNEIREVLAKFFSIVEKDDIHIVAYLTLGKYSAEYESVILGLAEKSVLKALSKTCGVSEKRIKELTHEKGDAGLTAEIVMKKKPMTLVPVGKLSIHEFFDTLHKIATIEGSGSQDVKGNLLISMLTKCSPAGAKYVVRIVLGTMRLGVAEMAVLDSLAIAFTGNKENKKKLEAAYNICPDVGIIAETIAKKGLKGIEKIEVNVSRPIRMMLAQRVSELEQVSAKMPGKICVEGKYDGERVQAHKTKDGKIHLYSRRLDDTTAQFPDLVKYLESQINVKEFVLEGEILAIDVDGNPKPFQLLMQRRRKYDVEKYIEKIPVQLKVFDVLYVDGKSLLDESYEKRDEMIKKIVVENNNVKIADKLYTNDVDEINDFFHEMLDAGYEGIIIKSMDGLYQAGTRGWNWIKWKKDYVKDMVDTFDLIVIGAFYGRGRRKGTYGALLCAVYDDINDQFLSFCKLGTGLTDEVLEGLPGKLERYKSEKIGKRVISKMKADVWFEPALVVEVEGAEVTKSPSHTAGMALRFPRFLRFRDKKVEDATTLREVDEMA